MVNKALMTDVTAIYPKLMTERAKLSYGVGPNPQSLAEVVSAGQPSGIGTMIQKLLQVRGEIGGPDKARAEQQDRVPEFHNAPITYDGFAQPRLPPTQTINLIA